MKITLAVVLSLTTSATNGFVSQPSQPKGRLTLVRAIQGDISWKDYKHDFIDPIASSDRKEEVNLEGRMDPTKRLSADGFWLAHLDDQKEKLNKLNEQSATLASAYSPNTSFETYKHECIDPMTSKPRHSSELKVHMDPSKRAKADEFWLQSYLEEKEGPMPPYNPIMP